VVTEKGHGFDYASKDPVTYHSPTAFAKEDGELTKKTGRPSYSSAFATTLISMAEDDPRIVAITAAMAQGTALDKFGERFPERLFDVGIAEQHAVAFSTGLAKSGMRPVAAIYSTFLQRAYDQVFQEVCLQDQPVVFAIDRAGITGGDGATAQGNFDIAYLRTLPRISIMAPRNGSELNLMMRYAMESTGPIAIRYPRESIPKEELDDVPAPIEHGRGELLREGEDLALFALGAMVIPALEAAEALEEEGISAAVINARFAKPVDWRLLEEWTGRVPMLVTLEDHALHGGFGSAALETASDHRLDLNKIRRIGIPDRFIEHGSRTILMEKLGLDARGICNSIRKFFRATASKDAAVAGPAKA
jgi:1-deoxy-D-xylulose-5-phosphate synthase